MAYSVFPAPAAGGKILYRTTLTSGTSYTVPAGVTLLDVTLVGGGGGGGGAQCLSSGTVTSGGTGGTTSFTGATSALGGNGGQGLNIYGGGANGYGAGTSGVEFGDAGTNAWGHANIGQTSGAYMTSGMGTKGQRVSSTVTTTPGASISYSIGSGGSAGTISSGTGQGGGAGAQGCIYIEYWL